MLSTRRNILNKAKLESAPVRVRGRRRKDGGEILMAIGEGHSLSAVLAPNLMRSCVILVSSWELSLTALMPRGGDLVFHFHFTHLPFEALDLANNIRSHVLGRIHCIRTDRYKEGNSELGNVPRYLFA